MKTPLFAIDVSGQTIGRYWLVTRYLNGRSFISKKQNRDARQSPMRERRRFRELEKLSRTGFGGIWLRRQGLNRPPDFSNYGPKDDQLRRRRTQSFRASELLF
jgi:hypothetical protein